MPSPGNVITRFDIFSGEKVDCNDGDSLAHETTGIKVMPVLLITEYWSEKSISCKLNFNLKGNISLWWESREGGSLLGYLILVTSVIVLLNPGCASSQPPQPGWGNPRLGRWPYVALTRPDDHHNITLIVIWLLRAAKTYFPLGEESPEGEDATENDCSQGETRFLMRLSLNLLEVWGPFSNF